MTKTTQPMVLLHGINNPIMVLYLVLIRNTVRVISLWNLFIERFQWFLWISEISPKMKETEQMIQGIFLFYLFVLKIDFEKLVLFLDSLSENMVSFHFSFFFAWRLQIWISWWVLNERLNLCTKRTWRLYLPCATSTGS